MRLPVLVPSVDSIVIHQDELLHIYVRPVIQKTKVGIEYTQAMLKSETEILVIIKIFKIIGVHSDIFRIQIKNYVRNSCDP